MAPSNGTRKRQTRLAFTPLPSSSPAAKGYHKQVQDRAAAVSLEPSPSRNKRRKLSDHDIVQLDGEWESLPMPTPAASAPQRNGAVADTSESEEEPVRSTQRRSSTQDKRMKSKRNGQKKLDWSSMRVADSFSSPIKLSSPSRPRSSARAGIFGTQRQRPIFDESSDDESDDLPSPGKLTAERSSTTGKAGQRSSGARSTRSTKPIVVESESDGDNIVVGSERQNEIEPESEDEEEEMPTTMGTQRRKRTRRNSFISSSPPGGAIDSDDDLEIIENPRNRGRRNSSQESDAETPRRKLKRSRKATQREKDDLAEDLDFLGPSSDVEESGRAPRSTQNAAKSAKQNALEQLKQRRSGLQAASELAEDDPGQLYDEESDDVGAKQPRMNSTQMFNEDDYDQEFIEEDDGDLGVPDDLPLEFTRYASMKPKELFKYAVEWMVQKKINPAFNLTDPLYGLSFRKLDDEVRGLAGSKFTSAAWTPEFTIALKSRPEIAFESIDRNEGENWLRDSCDACNRSGHPATFQIQFQGKPYNPKTLEELGGDGEEDEDDSASSSDGEGADADDQPAYDISGQQIPPANHIYYVGKFCMSNAQTAHALQHWRYHLNEWVVTWLDAQGYNTPEKIVQRDGRSTKKRRKEANRITDRMEQEGVIKELWNDFYQNINEARNSKQGRWRHDSP